MDRIQQLREAFREQLEAMSPRDRNLLVGLIAGIALLVVGLITWNLKSVIQDQASRVVVAKENLALAQDLAQDYADLEARILAAEARMGEYNPQAVATYLETWARSAGVDAGFKIDKTSASTVGAYKEQGYRVDVQRSSLPGILSFLYAIETSPYPIRVRSSRFKVIDTKDDRFIDLGLELVAYSKEEEG